VRAATPPTMDAPAVATQQAVRGRMHREFPPPPPGKHIFPVDAASNCVLWRGSFGSSHSVDPAGHQGTDIMGSGGRAGYAIAPGQIVRRFLNTGSAGWGWTIVNSATNTTYRYFHLTENAATLRVDDRVEVGDVIGYVGDSGTTAGNFHLHLEIRPGDVAVDPLPLLDIPPICRVI